MLGNNEEKEQLSMPLEAQIPVEEEKAQLILSSDFAPFPVGDEGIKFECKENPIVVNIRLIIDRKGTGIDVTILDTTQSVSKNFHVSFKEEFKMSFKNSNKSKFTLEIKNSSPDIVNQVKITGSNWAQL